MERTTNDPDVSIYYDSSIAMVSAVSDDAQEWVEDYVDVSSGSIERFPVELRYIEDLTRGMIDAGLFVVVNGNRVKLSDEGEIVNV